MREVDFQKHLADAAGDLGGHAFKCNNQYLAGVSDLSIKLPALPHVYLEAKRHDSFNGSKVIGLTPLQERFLKDYRSADGVAGWVSYAPIKGQRDCYHIVASSNITREKFDFAGADKLVKMRGGPWPIEEIIRAVCGVRSRVTYSGS